MDGIYLLQLFSIQIQINFVENIYFLNDERQKIEMQFEVKLVDAKIEFSIFNLNIISFFSTVVTWS